MDEDEDYYNEEYEDQYEYADIQAIQEEYRRKRLIESLIGPVISTLFHMGLIVILAILITDKYKEEAPEIVVKMEEVKEVKIEEPPPVEEPEPVEEPIEDVVNPVLSTVALENVDTNDAALEDVNDEAPSTDDDSTVEAVSDVTVSPSAFASPDVFGGRSAAGRASAVSKFGGTSAGQNALKNALWWLAKVQNPDGSWGKMATRYQRAWTSLALLTFLAHGETHFSKNFGSHVKKAIGWLVNDPVGKVNDSYSHGIKTYALCEAYAMTGLSSIEDQMNFCLEFILNNQQKGGSFTYNYRAGPKEDLSVAGWNYQALKAAYGAGCASSKLQSAIDKSIAWLKSKADEESNGNGFPYDGAKKSKGKHTMRGVGVLCLQLFGEGDYPGMKDEIQKIATYDLEKMNWQKPPIDSLYGWYYSTQAMFQKGGPQWKEWNAKFQKLLIKEQHPEGYWIYPGRKHGSMVEEFDEKVFATTLCCLMLTVYYRYLPSTKGAIGGKAETKKKKKPVIEEGLNLIE